MNTGEWDAHIEVWGPYYRAMGFRFLGEEGWESGNVAY